MLSSSSSPLLSLHPQTGDSVFRRDILIRSGYFSSHCVKSPSTVATCRHLCQLRAKRSDWKALLLLVIIITHCLRYGDIYCVWEHALGWDADGGAAREMQFFGNPDWRAALIEWKTIFELDFGDCARERKRAMKKQCFCSGLLWVAIRLMSECLWDIQFLLD